MQLMSMRLFLLLAVGIMLWPNVAGAVPRGAGIGQSSQSQQDSQTSTPANSNASQPQSAPATESKPCPEASQSGSAAKSDCKSSASGKPKSKGNKKTHSQPAAKSSDNGPSKKVVRDGSTGEPEMAISSGDNKRQLSRVEETNRLLASADLNLKDVAVRGLTASQQVTIKQIHSYMDQAKAAESSGDVERAYNLANKANMLAADLNAQ
jgi:hypothetical protein